MHGLSMDLNAVLRHAVESGASDIHFKVGQPPVFRFDGDLASSGGFAPLGDIELQDILERVTSIAPRRRELFVESGELDIAFSEPDVRRFRFN